MARREYAGKDITVTFDLARCIHVANCWRGLPEVFDTRQRPWVQPDGAPADLVAQVVERCPSGALQYVRHDGGPAEHHAVTSVRSAPDTPNYLVGDLEIHTEHGVVHTPRAALCRCGKSSHKPFCDNSHQGGQPEETRSL